MAAGSGRRPLKLGLRTRHPDRAEPFGLLIRLRSVTLTSPPTARVDARVTPTPDDHALAEALNRHLLSAYRLAALILRSESEAHDAVHDAVIRAWTRRGDLRDAAQFEAWFDRIVLNICRDRLRRKRRLAFVPLVESAPGHSAPGPEAWVSSRDELERGFAEMPFDLRAVVVLRFWADLPIAEVARRLGIPEGTVKSRLHSALGQLRANLHGEGRETGNGR